MNRYLDLILGQLILKNFINDIRLNNFGHEIILYADDTSILRKDNSTQVKKAIEDDLSKVYDWCKANRINPNPKKCE